MRCICEIAKDNFRYFEFCPIIKKPPHFWKGFNLKGKKRMF